MRYLFIMIFPLLLISGCKKEDLTSDLDITQYTWKITSIKEDGKKEKAPKGGIVGSNFDNSRDRAENVQRRYTVTLKEIFRDCFFLSQLTNLFV